MIFLILATFILLIARHLALIKIFYGCPLSMCRKVFGKSILYVNGFMIFASFENATAPAQIYKK
ncbi:hypothetical protein VI26_09695 [Chromobacterium sp. LK1]|nr:hypothetical protein VI26_09695 [Chromobacterium sp. LK1]